MNTIEKSTPAPAAAAGADVTRARFNGRIYLGQRRRVSVDGLTDFFAHSYVALLDRLNECGVDVTGAPIAIYHDHTGDTVDVTAAIPVATRSDAATASLPDLFTPGELLAGDAVTVKHYGRYDTLTRSYDLVEDWISAHHLHAAGTVWEQYLIGPNESPDPTSWCTRIVYPITDAAANPDNAAPGDGR